MSTATISDYDRRLARRTAKAQERGRAAAGEATDEALQQAYEMGLAGEKLRHEPSDDPRLREEHRRGLNERARTGRRQRARDVGSQSAGYLDRARQTVSAGASEGTGSFVGVAVAVLGVIALFLLLNRTSLATTVINGTVKGLTWFVSPSVLPF